MAAQLEIGVTLVAYHSPAPPIRPYLIRFTKSWFPT